MKQKSKYLLTFFTILFLTNCTIQKRTFNKGYFVQWHHKTNKQVTSGEKDDFSFSKTEKEIDDSLQILPISSSIDEVTFQDEEINSTMSDTKQSFFSPERILKSLPIVTNSVSEKFVNSFNDDNKEKQVNKKKVYFDKTKGRRALFYAILSVSCMLILLFFLVLWIGPFLNDKSELLIDSISILSVIVALLGFIVFPVLTIINLVKAFIKPKNSETKL